LNTLGLDLGMSGKSEQKILIREVLVFSQNETGLLRGRFCFWTTARLEDELRAELQNAGEVGAADFQEAVASEIS
jgi:hypothetical protein